MNTQGWSITPSRCSRSAMSRMPSPRGMLTTLSSASGPGASKRCLPTIKRAADGDRDHDQQREDRIADDHQRMAHASRAALGRRHAFRLERRARAARRLARLRRRRHRHGPGLLAAPRPAAMRRIGTHCARSRCRDLQARPSTHSRSAPAAAESRNHQQLSHVRKELWRKLGERHGMASRHSGGRSARHWCRRSRTNSTAPCRSRACAPHAAPDRSAFRPTDCRD